MIGGSSSGGGGPGIEISAKERERARAPFSSRPPPRVSGLIGIPLRYNGCRDRGPVFPVFPAKYLHNAGDRACDLVLLLPGEPTALRNRPRSFQTNESAQRPTTTATPIIER